MEPKDCSNCVYEGCVGLVCKDCKDFSEHIFTPKVYEKEINQLENKEELVYLYGWLSGQVDALIKIEKEGVPIIIYYEDFFNDYWKILFRLDELNEKEI